MIEIQKAKIISFFKIVGRGFVSEIQHNLNGLPYNTILKDNNTEEIFIVHERVFQGFLQIHDKEVYFDNETKFTHLSNRFSNEKEGIDFLNKEVEKRKNHIYMYFLKPYKKDIKPIVGQEYLIELSLS